MHLSSCLYRKKERKLFLAHACLKCFPFERAIFPLFGTNSWLVDSPMYLRLSNNYSKIQCTITKTGHTF